MDNDGFRVSMVTFLLQPSLNFLVHGTWSLLCSCSQMYRMIIAGDSWNPVSIQQNWLIWPSSMGLFILSPGSLYGNPEHQRNALFFYGWQRIIDVGLLIELPEGTATSKPVPFM